jgi:hypothetical protein
MVVVVRERGVGHVEAPGKRQSAMSYQLSVISYQLSVISDQPSAIGELIADS